MLSPTPLAERLRPKKLDDIIGQSHLLGENGALRKSIRSGLIPSIIFWGPPGVGKTTIARLLAEALNRPFHQLSAINSGVKDIRELIANAKRGGLFNQNNPIVFIDEIHRFSKSQQDSLLGAVEDGTITLIGATTENPSFEVIPALLSRSQVYVLNSFGQEELQSLLERAYAEDSWVKEQAVELEDQNILFRLSGGDGRKLLNTLELLLSNAEGKSHLSTEEVQEIVQQNLYIYDKAGEMHYDLISAFIKSVRGSDPDASMYYLCRMTASGEDPKFIARRLFILASEDIGLANPTALALASSCFEAVQALGYPECEIPLAECTIYLASSPKSNSAYMALKKAQAAVKEFPNEPVPLFLRNAPTKLMKELGYGADYKYPHEYPGAFVKQTYLPDALAKHQFYSPKDLGREKALKEYLDRLKS